MSGTRRMPKFPDWDVRVSTNEVEFMKSFVDGRLRSRDASLSAEERIRVLTFVERVLGCVEFLEHRFKEMNSAGEAVR